MMKKVMMSNKMGGKIPNLKMSHKMMILGLLDRLFRVKDHNHKKKKIIKCKKKRPITVLTSKIKPLPVQLKNPKKVNG